MTVTTTALVRFEDALELEYLDGRNWKVTSDFYYDTDVPLAGVPVTHTQFCDRFEGRAQGWRRIQIPAGFITDFASIPRVLWSILPPTGGYGKAAVVHDRLYRTPGLCTRAQADAVLKEAMQFLQVGWWTRQVIYAGVRVGGGSSYRGGL